MSGPVLSVIFQQPSDFLAQEAHLAKGAFFVPAPDPLPEPFAEIVLVIEAPSGEGVELGARVVQMSAKGIAVAFMQIAAAKQALAPLFEAAWRASLTETTSNGATWVFWGRPQAAIDSVPELAAAADAAPLDEPFGERDAAATDEQRDELLYDQIHGMGSQEKIRLALHGDRPSRLILVRDVNKTVQTFLVQNPRITIDEIRYIAGYRLANPEVLNTIARHRDWGDNAGIVSALVRNPKTPASTAVRLLDKLPMSEVRRIAKSGEAPQAVTIAARRRCTGA